jgi:hypothetical protein
VAARKKQSLKAEEPKAHDLVCSFCAKKFVHEGKFLKHTCEQKRRFLDQDERHVKLGFWAYARFYEVAYAGKKVQTYALFSKSSFYNAFVKFGRHVLDINAISPQQFVDFLIKGKVPVDSWCSQVVYDTYVRELAKRESADAALERNFLLMQQWAMETDEEWTNFFRKVPTPLAVMQIRSGRISPWVLYTAPSGIDLLARFTPEQMGLVTQAIDPDFWSVKLAQHTDEVEAIRSTLEEAGL